MCEVRVWADKQITRNLSHLIRQTHLERLNKQYAEGFPISQYSKALRLCTTFRF